VWGADSEAQQRRHFFGFFITQLGEKLENFLAFPLFTRRNCKGRKERYQELLSKNKHNF
jgi:hypothetical protein